MSVEKREFKWTDGPDGETPAVFTLAELWVLRGCIRHGLASMHEQWPKFAPASQALNDQIVYAIVACEDYKVPEMALALSYADCLAIDYCVQEQAKDSAGNLAGRAILLKAARARKALADVYSTAIGMSDDPEVRARLATFRKAHETSAFGATEQEY